MLSTRFAHLAALPLAAFLMIFHAATAHAVLRTWPNAVSGSASTATNWSPNGVPTVSDDASFQTAGNYTVTWTSPQDTVGFLHAIGGTPAFSITSSLGVLNIFSLSLNGRATVAAGRLRSNMLVVGGTGFGRLIVTGSGSQVVSRSSNAATMFAETLSTSASIAVMNSGQLWSNSWIETARKSATTCSLVVNGALSGPSRFGTLTTAGGGNRGDVILSNIGTTYMDVSNGGQFECRGNLYVARRGNATLRQIDTTPLLDPFTWVYGTTYIGYEPLPSTLAGIGTVSVEGGIARFGGSVFLGDPDHTSGNADHGTFRMRSGTAILGGPLTMPTSLAGTLELVGGTLQLLGGISTIRQSLPFNVSSGVAAPALVVNGSSFTDVFSSPGSTVTLGVGRGGGGKARVCGFNAHLQSEGPVAIADSLGGTGVVEVDSSGIFSAYGAITVGPGGHLTALNDAIVSVANGVSQVATFQSTGAVTMDGALLTTTVGDLGAPGTLTGSGQLDGHWTNHSTMTIPAGKTLKVTGELDAFEGSITGGGTLWVAGALQASGTADVDVDVTNADLWPRGPFPTVLAAVRGTHLATARRPGLDGVDPLFGHLRIGGNLALGRHLHVRVGSRSSGVRDTLEVTGQASLADTLEIFTVPGNPPVPGDTITVLEAGSVTGTFARVRLDGGDPTGTMTVLYGPTSVKVVFGSTTAVGDDPPAGAGPRELRFSTIRQGASAAFVLDLPHAARVQLALYDVSGREVVRLADDALTAGRHEFAPARGTLASGIYFARARIDAGGAPIVKIARAAMLK